MKHERNGEGREMGEGEDLRMRGISEGEGGGEKVELEEGGKIGVQSHILTGG